jgi:hypothetical protein
MRIWIVMQTRNEEVRRIALINARISQRIRREKNSMQLKLIMEYDKVWKASTQM